MAEQPTPVLIPIGVPLGHWYREGLDLNDPEAPIMAQRFGNKWLALPVSTYTVWDSTFDQNTRDELIGLATSRGVSDAHDRLNALLDDGGIVNLNGDFQYVKDLMGYYRLIPAGVGLGNSESDPTRYEIGLPGEPRFAVNPVTYSVWAVSNSEPSLLKACEVVAEDTEESLESVVTLVAYALPTMLKARVAFMDAS